MSRPLLTYSTCLLTFNWASISSGLSKESENTPPPPSSYAVQMPDLPFSQSYYPSSDFYLGQKKHRHSPTHEHTKRRRTKSSYMNVTNKTFQDDEQIPLVQPAPCLEQGTEMKLPAPPPMQKDEFNLDHGENTFPSHHKSSIENQKNCVRSLFKDEERPNSQQSHQNTPLPPPCKTLPSSWTENGKTSLIDFIMIDDYTIQTAPQDVRPIPLEAPVMRVPSPHKQSSSSYSKFWEVFGFSSKN